MWGWVYGVLATNARMGVVVAEASQEGKCGVGLWVHGVLVTNARMGVVVAEASQVGKFGVGLCPIRSLWKQNLVFK